VRQRSYERSGIGEENFRGGKIDIIQRNLRAFLVIMRIGEGRPRKSAGRNVLSGTGKRSEKKQEIGKEWRFSTGG